ncbi:hypothetical protein [Burkholderia sp. AcTa6-5]|uniref:hypothetical protein n=1 Tax=Burkholderia sp. AcTa6-5 TaxID=2821361 RepID=UPI001FD762F2|nr:hypothetical protein [Burkholderia sp. AcTa6-5]
MATNPVLLVKRSSIVVHLERMELECAVRLRLHRFQQGSADPLPFEFRAHVQLLEPGHAVGDSVCGHADDVAIVHGNGNVARRNKHVGNPIADGRFGVREWRIGCQRVARPKIDVGHRRGIGHRRATQDQGHGSATPKSARNARR